MPVRAPSIALEKAAGNIEDMGSAVFLLSFRRFCLL